MGIAVVVVVTRLCGGPLRAVEFVYNSLNPNLVTRRCLAEHVVVQP